MNATALNRSRRGFTLVEMLVAIAVFSILVAVGVGGFANALHTQREVAALIAVQSNASVALEQMAREMRTGWLFCDQPGSSPGTPAQPNAVCQLATNPNGTIASGCVVNNNIWTCHNILDFYNANGENVDYRLSGGQLARSATGISGAFSSLTGSNVRVAYLIFTIYGNTEGDHWPPRVTVSMGVAPNSTDPAIANDVVNLQTTVSAREIDCTQSGQIKC